MDDGIERVFDALVERLLRPARPRLDEARAAVRGIDDPREAWETLAARGFVPATWVDDPMRGFQHDDYTTHPMPERVLDAVLVAADAGGFATAEALAMEVAVRLGSWGRIVPQRRVWRIVRDRAAASRDPIESAITATHALRPLHVALAVAQRTTSRSTNRIEPARLTAAASASGCARSLVADLAIELHARSEWRLGVQDGWTYNRRPLRELNDPFDAALEIWRTGYVLLDVTREHVLLAARALPDA